MGGQGRYVGISLYLQDGGAIGGKCLGPGHGQRVGTVHIDTFEPDQFGKFRIGYIRQGLGTLVAGVAFHDPLLPGHLIQVFVVEHAHDEPRIRPLTPVFLHRDQLGHVVHLHRAIADQRNDRP